MSSPTVSIVVATYNRHEFLDALIEACERLDYPAHLIEVLIVDDGSEPPVRITGTHRQVRVLSHRHAGSASARNAGIRAASGELIALIDDDCLPRPDWLLQICKEYREHASALIGGRTENALTGNSYSVAARALAGSQSQWFRTPSNRHFFTASNIAGARARFLALGGFDKIFPPSPAQGADLCDRWSATGPVIHVPGAVVDIAHNMSLVGFFRQQWRHGWGARIMHRRRFARGGRFQFEPFPFYPGLFASTFRSNTLPRAASISILFLLAQPCNGAGYLWEAALGAWWLPEMAGVRRVARRIRGPLRARTLARNLTLLNDALAATPLAGRYWIMGGLLIGYAREGGILMHDAEDADFGLYRADLSRLLEAAPALDRAGFRAAHRYFNNDGETVALTWRRDHARFDFFVHDGLPEACSYTAFGTCLVDGRQVDSQVRSQVPAYSLIRFEFLRREWLKPADHDWYLTAIYGDWKTPMPRYNYMTDDRSIVEVSPWLRRNETDSFAAVPGGPL